MPTVYVTGASGYDNAAAIAEILSRIVRRFREVGETPVLLCAGGPGAEATAETWWRTRGLPVERLRLLERHHQPSAPYLLAHKAVQADPDLIVVFGVSKPAAKAIHAAELAEIPVLHIT